MKEATLKEVIIYLLAGLGLYHWVDYLLGVLMSAN